MKMTGLDVGIFMKPKEHQHPWMTVSSRECTAHLGAENERLIEQHIGQNSTT